jgi:hypothetical protein
MIDFILYIVALAVAFWAGIHYAQVRFIFRIGQEPDKFIKMLEQIREINKEEAVAVELGLPEDAIEVSVEQVNDMVYAYEKASGQFLAQAKSLHLAMVEATNRFPGKKFWHPELTKDTQTT